MAAFLVDLLETEGLIVDGTNSQRFSVICFAVQDKLCFCRVGKTNFRKCASSLP